MTLRIDPALPVLWNTPHDVQLGLEHPVVRLNALSIAQEHMLSALADGTTRTALTIIASSHGAPAAEIDELLGLVEPALSARPAPLTVRVADAAADRGAAATTMLRALADGGIHSFTTAEPTVDDDRDAHLDAVIVLADFVLPPDWYGHWLRRDVPHLPVVFGAASVRIGPLVEPGSGPCLYCIDRARSDADAAWPAHASQLWGRPSPARTTLSIAEATGVAVRMLQAAFAEPREHPRHARTDDARLIELDTATGRLSEQRMTRHPLCRCATLAETDSAIVTPIDAGLRPPRRAAATVAHA